MIGGIVTLLFFILRIIPSTADVAKVLVWFLRIFPSFCFGSGVINLGARKLFATIEGKDEDYEVFDVDITLADIICLAVTGLIYIILVFVIEVLNEKGTITKLISKENTVPHVPKPLDADVEDEA